MTNSPDEDVAAIKKLLSETYGGLVMSHNAAGYADMYSDDVLWAPPNGPDQKSKEGIKFTIKNKNYKKKIDLAIALIKKKY